MKLLPPFLKKKNQYDYANKRYSPLVDKINAFEQQLSVLDDEALKQRSIALRKVVAQKLKIAGLSTEKLKYFETTEEKSERRKAEDVILNEQLVEAFALVREASRRVNGERHFDVQLMAGAALHEGNITEMATGEGKTLVATLPLYLNALLGRGAHLITVNDYLAKLGAGWMGRIFDFLGMTTAVIGHDISYLYDGKSEIENTDERMRNFREITRNEAYRADITYGTNNEFGFDYLRDNMVPTKNHLVQRPFQFAIVDEVDSILIDEARTPLIISAAAEESANLYLKFAQAVRPLKDGEHYSIDEKMRSVSINDQGIERVQELLGISNLYAPESVVLVHHLEEALKAQAMFRKDRDYVVKDGEIIIVDEFTGRMMPGRRYSGGLHQAIEAKEGVEVKRESDTLATISFQNLFRLYPKLSGMTGTAATEAEEFYKIYKLDVITAPTNRPNVRVDYNDRIYKSEEAKLNAVVEEVKRSVAKQQPVLLGTISIVKSELVSKALKKHNIKHQVLNAKAHEREAKIISQAGKPGTVTVATNMAGRGVDIVLGGFPSRDKKGLELWQRDHQIVKEAGGLKVIGTERHEARRIDNQLRGRAARQGDPGESIFFVCLDDDLMRVFGGDRLRRVMNNLGLPDDQPITHKLISRSIESAQKRVEGYNFDTRKHLVEYDDIANKQREIIYRKRRSILELDVEHEDWLHQEIVNLLDDEERQKYLKKLEVVKPAAYREIEQSVYLRSIDLLWIEHLNALDELRQGIGLRGYGQREPLVEYKQDAFRLFERLKQETDNRAVEILLRLEVQQAPPPPIKPRPTMVAASNMLKGTKTAPSPVEQDKKIGRNDLCFCGSGKKFKKCHGK